MKNKININTKFIFKYSKEMIGKKLKPRININVRFGENFFNKIWCIWLLSGLKGNFLFKIL